MTAIKPSGNVGSPWLLPALGKFKLEHLVAGISGGVVSTVMLHPLDLIKIRFAVNDGLSKSAPQYSGLINACKVIKDSEGYRGLWKGATPNIIGSGFSWGCYFLLYENTKTLIQEETSRKSLGPFLNWVAATNAGTLTLILTNPIWVVKTRLCLQYTSDVQLEESKRYKGIKDALAKIYKFEGVGGLYKGFIPGIFGVQHGAIQFMTYEEMKDKYNKYRGMPIDTKLSTLEYIFFAAVSKIIAAGTTYPYQVVRARLQDHHHNYRGTWHCMQLTWRGEGWRGFYKGLKINLIKVTPATVITFLTYENVSHYLRTKQIFQNPTSLVPAVRDKTKF